MMIEIKWVVVLLALAFAPSRLLEAAPLRLKTGTIDAQPSIRVMAQSAARTLKAEESATKYIVQHDGKVTPAWRKSLRDAGARILRYIPENAYLISVSGDALATIRTKIDHATLLPYTSKFRLDPAVALTTEANDVYSISLFSEAVRETYVERINSLANCRVIRSDGTVIRAELTPNGLRQVAEYDEVEYISIWTEPKILNNVAVQAPRMNVETVWSGGDSGFDLTGAGQVVAIADTGLDTGDMETIHADIRGRLSRVYAHGRAGDWSDSSGHGTHVAGSALGNGSLSSSPKIRGVAYGATLIFQSLEDADGDLVVPSDLTTLFGQAYADENDRRGARILSNSWGTTNAYGYAEASRAIDKFSFEHPDALILFAMGNAGVDKSPQDGVVDARSLSIQSSAKNCLSVGASENERTSGGNSEKTWGVSRNFMADPIKSDYISRAADKIHQGMAAFSGRGPCSDGRIKPDVVAPGTDVLSLRSQLAERSWESWYDDDGYYSYDSGTSMATPLVAGSCALVRQWLVERKGIANPDGATIKALLLAGAKSLAPGQYGTGAFQEIPDAYPNNVEGWGQVNLGNTVANENGLDVYDAQVIQDQEVQEFKFCVRSAGRGLTVVMAYADAPAGLASAKQLVDDLDLLVVSPSGRRFYPNSMSGPDDVNNVEGVRIPAEEVELGVYAVTVTGTSIPEPMDESLTGGLPDALRYSLVVNGAERMKEETSVLFVDAKGGAANIDVTNGVAWTVSTDVDWIALSSTSFSGSGKYPFSVDENFHWDERSGLIKMTSASCARTVMVVQGTRAPSEHAFFHSYEGASGCYTNASGQIVRGRSSASGLYDFLLDGEVPSDSMVIVDYSYSHSMSPDLGVTTKIVMNGTPLGLCESSGRFSVPARVARLKAQNTCEVVFVESPAYDDLSWYTFQLYCTGTVTVCRAPAAATVKYSPGTYGTGSEVCDAKIAGADLPLYGTQFKRAGYSLIGWSEQDGAETAQYGLFDVYKRDESICLYPVWSPVANDYGWEESDEGVKITKYFGGGGEIEIPNTLNGRSVVAIGEEAFADCYAITAVTVPPGVVSIGNRAFMGCLRLQELSIPSSVTNIGVSICKDVSLRKLKMPSDNYRISHLGYSYDSALEIIEIAEGSVTVTANFGYDNVSRKFLTSLIIPGGVTSIGDYAFSGCSGLTSIKIPGSVTSIGDYAFSGCCGLTSIKIPDSVTSIGNGAFSGCSGLTTITIPSGVRSLSKRAFSSCSGLTAITIQTGVRAIGDEAFKGCARLTSITIPASVTLIGNYAFGDCSDLTSITIPDSVTSIGSEAFWGCRSLTSATIPNGVTRIGNCTFYGCRGLTSIKIPDSVTSIGDSAFENCRSLTSIRIPDGVTSIDDEAFRGCSGLASVTIPDSVTSIGDYAFYGCNGLTSLTIPDSVTSIGKCAFSDCNGLVNAGGFVIVNGMLYNYTGNATEITIPEDVRSIGTFAFNGCSSLKSVTIPSCVTNVAYQAFYKCSNLTSATVSACLTRGRMSSAFAGCGNLISVTIQDGVTIIGDSAFKDCRSLTSITIPDSVTSIGDSAFSSCSGLTSIKIPDGVTSIGYNAFYGCSGLTEITIPDSVTSINCSAFDGCTALAYDTTSIPGLTLIDGWVVRCDSNWSIDSTLTGIKGIVGGAFSGCGLTSVRVPTTWSHIGDSAFRGCSHLTSVTIPSGVTRIGDYAFYGCSSLTSIKIPAGVTSIGNSAFEDCISLTTIAIPDGVTRIGDDAFSDCSKLTSVTIPNSVTSIGDDAFCHCRSLTSITIPDGVTRIGSRAFCGCSKLSSITIPDSVTSIGVSAFSGCGGLTSITIPNSVTNIGNSAFEDCIGLTSITIPDGMTSIEADAFSGCSGLVDSSGLIIINGVLCKGPRGVSEITIPEGVTSIGDRAFYGSEWLTSVTIPNSVTNIGGAAFARCRRLRSITIPNRVMNIGGGAFSGSGLASLIIPESVTSIGSGAFRGSRLTSITIPASVTNINYASAFADCRSLSSIVIMKCSTAKSVVVEGLDNWIDWKTAVVVSPDVKTITPNGAAVRVMRGEADITAYLDIPAAVGGVIDLGAATVKPEFANEPLDVTKGAQIDLSTPTPQLSTSPTRKGLAYRLKEGATLEAMEANTTGDSTIGDGAPWTPNVTVKGGASGFYSIRVSK